MFSRISEKQMHTFRYVLVVGWLLLILSLFYDPISQVLTDPETNFFSPLKDSVITRANNPDTCIQFQGECLPQAPYPIGTRIFWGMVVPAGIAIVFVFGHETWRRICPLYFLSQIPRALGVKPKLKINQNKWLLQNSLYLQFGLFFIGLNLRILFVNSARPLLGLFLLMTIAVAIAINYFYGGRSWCHYVCPFGLVQMTFTGPRGLLASEAQKQPPRSITQSMCRTFDAATKTEKVTCISCKSPCMDIDSEKAYWEQLTKPGRRFVHYGYLGLVFAYFIYNFLSSGNFAYSLSDAGLHLNYQLGSIFKPGFYLAGQAIPIPKLIASPLTMAVFVAIFYFVCSQAEKIYGNYLKKSNPKISKQVILHRSFTICTFIAFNAFYVYGGRAEINRLPFILQMIFNGLVVLVSAFWLHRTWGRTSDLYQQESIADKLRRNLQKLNLDFTRLSGGRSLGDLQANELVLLDKILPQVTRQDRLKVYQGVLEESLEAGSLEAANSLKGLEEVRKQLKITQEEHYSLLTELGIKDPTLLKSPEEYSHEQRLRIESYRTALIGLLEELVNSGMPVLAAVETKTKQVSNLKNEYNISKQEHLQVLSGLFNALRPQAERLLALLQVENSRYQVVSDLKPHSDTPVFVLLRKLLSAKQQLIITPLLAVLEMLNNEPDVVELARRTGILAPNAIAEVLKDPQQQWQQRLNPVIFKELQPLNPESMKATTVRSGGEHTQIYKQSLSAEAVDNTLLELLQEPNPITEAASLYALTQLNRQKGLAVAELLLQQPLIDDLVKDTAAKLLGRSSQTAIIEQLMSVVSQPHFASLTVEQLLSMVKQSQQGDYSNRDITEIAPPREW
jgi:hypothetical protein